MANTLAGLLNANPSALRPILDIHHVELFLAWVTFWKVGRNRDIACWFLELQQRLLMRRLGKAGLPFIDGYNSLAVVFESAASGQCVPELGDKGSVFLTCMLELCFSLPLDARDNLLRLIYRHLVLGNDEEGLPLPNCAQVDLMLWLPPEDWGERILSQSLADEGSCFTVNLEDEIANRSGNSSLADRIKRFVDISRGSNPFRRPEGLPASVIILACLKYGTPLPPEMWRQPIFGPFTLDTPARAKPKTKRGGRSA